MKDLKIQYLDRYGKTQFESYKTIMEFTDFIEEHPNHPLNDGHHVRAEFFDHYNHVKYFTTITELYNFCISIMK